MSSQLQHAPPRPAPARRPRPAAAPPAKHGLGFALFLLVNVVLFVRPADFIPGLLGVEVYQYLILACLLVSFPAILQHLDPKTLERRPIDLCVLLLLPAVCLSHLTHAELDMMATDGFAFFKIVVYYLLFVSLVTTPARLRLFTSCLIICTAGVAILAMCDFYQVIRLPRMKNALGLEAPEDPTRMYGPGIFQDPNDLCVLLITVAVLLLGKLADHRAGLLRWLWLAPLGLFAFGVYLTQSRGGFLALAAGLGVLFVLRYGWQRGLLFALVAGPALFVVLVTRQADLSSQHDTGQARIQLWNEGFVMFRANPLFGVGMNRYQEDAGQVAHNSYMHAFGELGFFGGVLFLATVYLAIEGLYRLHQPYARPNGWQPRRILDPDLAQQYPFVAAAFVCYAVGMFSLTLNYLVTTYTFLGMASMIMATARTDPPTTPQRFESGLWVRLSLLSLAFLAGMFVLVRLLFRA